MTPHTAPRALTTPPPTFAAGVVVEHAQENGKAIIVVSDPATGTRERFSERSYQALTSLAGHDTLRAWLDAVIATHPNASPDKLMQLVDRCVASGLLVAAGPSAPARRDRKEPPRAREPAINSLEGPAEPMRPKLNKGVTRVGVMPPAGAPQARVDLAIAPGPFQDLQAVSTPRMASPVYLFTPELETLRLLDGKRSADEILVAFRTRGWPTSHDQLARYLLDMAGLGLLVDTGGAAPKKSLAPTPWIDGPAPDVENDRWSNAERTLFDEGVRRLRTGAVNDAIAQCEALVSMHPLHGEGQRLLEALRRRMPRPPLPMPMPFEDEKPERTMVLQLSDDLAAALRSPIVAEPAAPVAAPAPAQSQSQSEQPAQAPAEETGPASDAYEQAAQQIDSDPDVIRRRRLGTLRRVGRALVVPALLCGVSVVVPYPLTITYPAVVRPSERYVVRSPRNGVIGDIRVDEGQRVTANQVLGTLANADQRTSVIKTQSSLEKAQAELKMLLEGSRDEEIARASARLNGAYRELEVAKQRLDRVRGLVKSGVAPRTELEQAQAQAAQLSGAVNQAQADLNLVRAGAREDEVKKKEAEIRSIQAQLELENGLMQGTVLSTSLAGIVTTSKPRDLINTRVAAGDPVVEVANFDTMRVEVLVNERDFDVLKLGLPVELKVAAHPTDAFSGTVTRIGSQIEVTPEGNIIRAEAIVDNAGGLLVPNMTGYAGIKAEDRPVISLVMRRMLRWVRVRFLI